MKVLTIKNCKDCLCLSCTILCPNCEYCMSINYGNYKRICNDKI